jgi:hypothetical protein
MRVERGEVELAGDQEDDDPDGRQAREAASAPLGGLEQAIECFEEAVGLTGLGLRHDRAIRPEAKAITARFSP